LGKLEKTEGVGSSLYTWIQFTLDDGLSIEVRVEDGVVCLADEVGSLVMQVFDCIDCLGFGAAVHPGSLGQRSPQAPLDLVRGSVPLRIGVEPPEFG